MPLYSELTLCRSDAQEYEKRLSYTIFAFIRAGRSNEAMELCRQCHQPWLAAIIRGAQPFSWPALTSREPLTQLNVDPDAMQEEEDGISGWSGNKRRKLWRDACIRATATPVEFPSNLLGLKKVR